MPSHSLINLLLYMYLIKTKLSTLNTASVLLCPFLWYLNLSSFVFVYHLLLQPSLLMLFLWDFL